MPIGAGICCCNLCPKMPADIEAATWGVTVSGVITKPSCEPAHCEEMNGVWGDGSSIYRPALSFFADSEYHTIWAGEARTPATEPSPCDGGGPVCSETLLRVDLYILKPVSPNPTFPACREAFPNMKAVLFVWSFPDVGSSGATFVCETGDWELCSVSVANCCDPTDSIVSNLVRIT